MTDTATLTAFLFTDIEGSSLKWLNRRAAMQEALAAHDRILRAAIAAYEGEVFKTAGDAFFATFKRPSDAANAAIAAQKTLAASDWSAVDGLKVRMAVHCGTAEKREGDWFGPALNRCARLLVLGHGGQILVSSATAELLASEREVKDPMRQVGTHPLDDPAQPVGIHQVLVAGLPQDFPPLRAPETRPTNLPRHPTPLIGRENELKTIEELVMANRLVTLTGPGGVGKTRLAIEAGRELLPRFANGVWLVELAPLSDAQLVVSAVGTGLRLDLGGNRPPRDILISHLENQDRLIVLDNCEHLVDAVAELVEALLAGTSRVRILASSQELIGLPGEQVLRIPSLALPDNVAPGADEALKASAVQMFVERVNAADGRFLFDDKAASTAISICKRLDGVPLALEMAAARVPALGLDAVAQGLDDRFRLLTGGKRTALPRQRTLHAALDWSHALLSEQDRKVFRRLGVFSGGFTLRAATSVLTDGTLRDFEVVDCLGDLVAKSLVVVDTTDAGTRYRLLETTRAYALEKLGEAGEGDFVAKRHAQFYRDRMEACTVDWFELPTLTWRATYVADVDNVRGAAEWCFGPTGDAEIAVALVAYAGGLLEHLSRYDENRRLVNLAETKLGLGVSRKTEAAFWTAKGQSLLHGGYNPSDEAVAALERAATLARGLDDRLLSRALAWLGLCRVNRSEADRADDVLAELNSLAERFDSPARRGWYRTILGMCHGVRSDLGRARSELAAAAALANSAGMIVIADFSDMLLGLYIWRSGEHDAAVNQLIALREKLRQPLRADARRLQGTNAILSMALSTSGRHAEALAAAHEAIDTGRKIGTTMASADGCVYILAAAGEYARAARLAGWADAWATREPGVLRMGQLWRPPADEILRQHLSSSDLERLMGEGVSLSAQEACALLSVE